MGAPKTPKQPKPPPTPDIQDPGKQLDEATLQALEDRKRAAAQYSARASTLATSGQGAAGTATVGTKSLLGG